MSRAYCYRCYRPQTACFCSKITRVENLPHIVILQHKDEVRHPKGTAIIADLSLQKCSRFVGEDFSSHEELNNLLEYNPGRVFLVFPAGHAIPLSALKKRYAIEENALDQYIFLFIDASWRKARKIWHLSTNLHPLTTIELEKSETSNYRIRKAPGPGLVSTLESIVSLLSCLESEVDKYRPLLEIFNEMIDQQIESMGNAVYQKNYKP